MFRQLERNMLSRVQNTVAMLQQQISGMELEQETIVCGLRSAFVIPSSTELSISQQQRNSHESLASAMCEKTEGYFNTSEDISVQITNYLDLQSLGRMQQVCRQWKEFIGNHRNYIFQQLLASTHFQTIIPDPNPYISYLLSLRTEIEYEIQHNLAIQQTHKVLETYCTITKPYDHGFISMFCDIVHFSDPKIARFVAKMRQSALNMVLVRTPENVQTFRKLSEHAGPITFVPVENPHWPVFDLPQPMDTIPGFLGYAFEHVDVVKGYESVKETVVKSILKNLMIFDTVENSHAYARNIVPWPFVAALDDGEPVQSSAEREQYPMRFTNFLREPLKKLSVMQRITKLREQSYHISKLLIANGNDI